jgi:hypothetical protein
VGRLIAADLSANVPLIKLFWPVDLFQAHDLLVLESTEATWGKLFVTELMAWPPA